MHDMIFRLTLYIISSKDDNYSRGLSLDIKCEPTFYNKYFKEIDIDQVLGDSSPYDKRLFTKSYELLDQKIVMSLKSSIKALESYAKEMYPNNIYAFLYGEERTNLINQVRTLSASEVPNDPEQDDTDKPGQETEYKELWIVRDDPANKQWVFMCRTLYKVPITKNRKEEVERTYNLEYSSLWKYFGVDVGSCDRSDIKMFMNFILDSMKLKMPTINMRSADDDPDQEEEVYISIENIQTVCNVRHIVNIDGKRLPITLSLIGNSEIFFGIKIVTYHREDYFEQGVFLRVDTEEWKYSDEYIAKMPRHYKKDKLYRFYELPTILEESGFEDIFTILKFNEDRVPFVENKFGEVTKVDALCKRDFEAMVQAS